MADTKLCRYCGNVIPRNAQNCGYCGKYLMKKHDNPDLVCEQCKAPVNTDDNFCQECGAIFGLPDVEIVAEPPKGNMMGIPYNIGILLKSFAAAIAITLFMTADKDASVGNMFLIFGISFVAAEVLFYIYFLPTIIAIEKNNPNICVIYICNLLFGITVIGWFVTLIMGLSSEQTRY